MPGSSRACAAAGTYLTAVRAGQHAGFDRVVFEFSGGTPAYAASAVKTVYSDAKGDVVPLPGQMLLRVVFRAATVWCPGPGSRTYAGPPALTPFMPPVGVPAGMPARAVSGCVSRSPGRVSGWPCPIPAA